MAGFPPASGLSKLVLERKKTGTLDVRKLSENDSHMLAHVRTALLNVHIWEMIIAIAMVECHLS